MQSTAFLMRRVGQDLDDRAWPRPTMSAKRVTVRGNAPTATASVDLRRASALGALTAFCPAPVSPL
jgi:hypothetical protein